VGSGLSAASALPVRLRHGLGRPAQAGWPALAWLALAGLVAVIWVTYVRPLAHFDVDVFLRAGADVAAGRNPYPRPGSAQVYSGFSFVYPYLVAFPFAVFAWLPRAGAEAAFIGLSVLAVLGGCWLAGARRWLAYALVLTASCTITGLQMGTLNAVLFAGLAALWRLRDRPVAAGLLAALLVYSKLFLVPLPLWLLLTRRWRAAAVAAATAAAVFGAGQLVSPVGLRDYAGMLDALARAEAPDGLSLTGLLMNAGLRLGVATWAARAAAGALIVSCCAAGYRSVWREQPAAAGDGRALAGPAPAEWAAADRLVFAGTVAAALLASPIVWSHYLLLLAVPLLVIEGGERLGALAVATAASWLLVTPHLSTPPEVAVSAVVVALLVARPLREAARREAARHGEARGPGPTDAAAPAAGGRALTAALATVGLPAAAVAALTGAGLELFWSLARTHRGQEAVTGAYLATLGMLALLAWAARRGRERG
jgi:hypothetical protein